MPWSSSMSLVGGAIAPSARHACHPWWWECGSMWVSLSLLGVVWRWRCRARCGAASKKKKGGKQMRGRVHPENPSPSTLLLAVGVPSSHLHLWPLWQNRSPVGEDKMLPKCNFCIQSGLKHPNGVVRKNWQKQLACWCLPEVECWGGETR
jgi:hypothetical protein